MKKLRLLIVLSILTLGNHYTSAQNTVSHYLDSALQSKIDAFINVHNLPGVSVSVILPGNQHWNGAAGLSHIYNLSPMDTNHLFQMASVNKLYTSAMIFQLKEQGLLHLDDSLGTYLPAMVNVPGSTTIRNLLVHKSGISDIATWPGIINEWLNYPDSIWPHLLVMQTFVDPPLIPQGTNFHYSNSNYILLGMIIEQLTGRTFAQELKTRFLTPLGLNKTFFAPDDDSLAIPQTPGWTSFTTAGVYNTDASAILNDNSASMFFTSGSIIAQPADVARFTRLLWTGQIISSASLDTMMQCTNVAFGQGCDGYGYGTMRYQFYGKTSYGHAGDVNGFTQLSIHQPVDSITLTISVNRNGAPRGAMADEIFDLLNQISTEINSLEKSNSSISIYPNPASEKIHVIFNSKKQDGIDITIMNQYGVEVKVNPSMQSNEVCEINISNLSSGIYYLHIQTVAESILKKIVIEHRQ